MDRYVTGSVIRRLRESKRLTQEELAEKVYVSGKAVSKWETGRGLPDISLLEPLAKALHVSVIELLSGENIQNQNRSSNIAKGKLYVCPICGNVLWAIGDAVICCCGVTLPPLEAENAGQEHTIHTQLVEDEIFVSLDHPMEKAHYISFLAAVSDQSIQIVKLYPEGNAEARFKCSRVTKLYAYCKRHGLFQLKPAQA